jgi:glucokinase
VQAVNSAAFSIGVDFGGTNLRIGAYARESGLLETIPLPMRLRDGPDGVAIDMAKEIRQLRDRHSSQRTLAGIGVGSPGPLELPAGRLRQPPNLPGWDNFELRATLERALGTRVIVENDANVAALAEYALGTGKRLGVDSLCMLTLGTGVGAGIVLRGRIWDGMNGMAGEAGHVNVWTDGVACGCGGQGCLEPYASATAVRRMANEMIAEGKAPGLAALQKRNPDFSAREVAELALAGDANAKAIYEMVGRSLGIGLASMVNLLNMPLYVIGGGVASAWELFAPALFEELRHRSYVYRLSKPEVTRADLGAEAGLLGACLLPFSAAEVDS